MIINVKVESSLGNFENCLNLKILNNMKKFKRKFRAILDVIKSDKFFLATFKENNELDWWTEYNITRDEYIDKL